MPKTSDLEKQAARFARDELGHLLNRTITKGIPIRAAMAEDGRAVVGMGVSKRNPLSPDAIPITIGPQEPRCYLHLYHSLYWSDHGFLAVSTSSYALYLTEDLAESSEIFRYDFEREKTGYPPVHLQVYGRSKNLESLMERAGREWRNEMSRIHFPLGDKRFRPCLEDIVEFLILEKLVDAQDGWEGVVKAHRDEFHRHQLGAAVARDPETAAIALRKMGYSIEGPAD